MTDLWWELRSPTRPDLSGIARQVQATESLAAGYLVSDNHLGHPTVSSLVVGQEVVGLGGRAVVCINARDRNRLGFARDLLTAAALGLDRLLLVQGDRVEGDTSGLRVRTMVEQARKTSDAAIGVTSRLGPLPGWKREADFLFVQVSFSAAELARWRESVTFDGPVYAGVLVLASEPMARRLAAAAPEIEIPEALVEAVARDPWAGVEAAHQMIEDLSHSGFDGFHLIPGVRYRAMAARLAEGGLLQPAVASRPGYTTH